MTKMQVRVLLGFLLWGAWVIGIPLSDLLQGG